MFVPHVMSAADVHCRCAHFLRFDMLEMKAEAKDYKLNFLERENARLRRLVPRA